MAGYYNIDDGLGNQITVGLQPHQARRVAERIANERGESVFLYKAGEDESEEIDPSETSKRRCPKSLSCLSIDRSCPQTGALVSPSLFSTPRLPLVQWGVFLAL